MSQPSIFWWQKYGTLRRWRRRAWRCSALWRSCSRSTNPLEQSRHQRAAGIFGLYRSGIKNPKFAAPDYDVIKQGGRDQRTQYESFVSYFLYACEEALTAFADKREWQASCDYDLKPHLTFLCEKNKAEPTYLATYGPTPSNGSRHP